MGGKGSSMTYTPSELYTFTNIVAVYKRLELLVLLTRTLLAKRWKEWADDVPYTVVIAEEDFHPAIPLKRLRELLITEYRTEYERLTSELKIEDQWEKLTRI